MKPIRPTPFWSDRSDTKIGNIVIGFNSGCFCFSNIHAYKYLQSVELHYLFLGFCVSPMVFVYISNGFCISRMVSVYHQWFLCIINDFCVSPMVSATYRQSTMYHEQR